MKIRLILDRITGKAIMAGDKAIAVRSTSALNIQQTSELSQSDYDALATKDTTTLYLITGTSGYVKAYIGDSPLYREPEPRTISGTSSIVFASIDGGRIKSLVRYGKCQQGSVPCVTSITQLGKCEQNGTPTPSASVDIVCNNGALKYSANMADVNADTVLVGYYIRAQGVVTADSMNWMYQRYIPVKPNTIYTLSMSSPVYYVTISEYSTAADSGFVVRKAGSTGGNTSLTITTGANTNYIRFGTNINRATVKLANVLAINWMLNLGGAAMDYQPYVEGGIYTDGTPETLKIIHNLYDASGVDPNHYYDQNGAYTETQTVQLSNRVPVKSGDVIVCTTKTLGTGSELNIRYNQLNTSGEWVSQEVQSQPRNTTRTKSVTINQDGFFCFSGTFSGTTYVDFDATIITIESETQTVSNLPMLLSAGDYKDEAELIQGVKTGKVGIKVFDGTEEWSKSAYNGVYLFGPSDMKVCNPPIVGVSTHFRGSSAATSSMPDMSIKNTYTDGGRAVLCVKYNGFSTTTDFQAWLAAQYANGTPVIVLYPLATETTEQLTAHPELTNGKYTTAYADGNVDDITVTVTRGVTSTPTPYNPIPIVCNNGEVTGQGASGTPEVLTLSAAGETDQTASVADILQVGDYKDEQEIISGLLTHRIGIVVFDGTEAWRASSSANIYILDSAIAVGLTAICTHFLKVSNTTSAVNMPDGSFKGHASNAILYLKHKAVGSLANFKAYLAAQYAAGTPVILLYSLATPSTEQVTPQPLICHMGTNEVESECNISDPEIKITYPE